MISRLNFGFPRETQMPDILVEVPDASIGQICIEHSVDPCPSMLIAKLFEQETIPIFITNSRHNSWKTVVMHTPYVSRKEVKKQIQKSKVHGPIKFFRSDPTRDHSIIGIDIDDGPLNTVTDSDFPVLHVKRYEANEDFEEFQMIVYREENFDKLRESLLKYGKTSVVSREPLTEHFKRTELQPRGLFRLLPPDEERIFWKAYEMGYFDYPKRARLRNLADVLGYPKSTLSIKLRRISEKLCEAYFKNFVEV